MVFFMSAAPRAPDSQQRQNNLIRLSKLRPGVLGRLTPSPLAACLGRSLVDPPTATRDPLKDNAEIVRTDRSDFISPGPLDRTTDCTTGRHLTVPAVLC